MFITAGNILTESVQTVSDLKEHSRKLLNAHIHEKRLVFLTEQKQIDRVDMYNRCREWMEREAEIEPDLVKEGKARRMQERERRKRMPLDPVYHRLEIRPQKVPSSEVFHQLGFEDLDAYLGDEEATEEWLFEVPAFPEFFPAPEDEILRRLEVHPMFYKPFSSLDELVSAYNITYAHHYEILDDWESLRTDPELDRFDAMSHSILHYKRVPMDIETFELLIVCLANDDYWLSWKEPPIGGFIRTWIIEWRMRLGKYNPAIDGRWRASVWKENWRDVRERLTDINRENAALPPAEGLKALALQLISDRKLTARSGELEADLVSRVERDLKRLAQGPWKEHITQVSGRPFVLHL